MDYLASLTPLVSLFSHVCWAIVKRTAFLRTCQVYWPSQSAPAHIISGVNRKNNYCLSSLCLFCPFGYSVTAWVLSTASHWIPLKYHVWLQQSRTVWLERLIECGVTNWSAVYRFSYVWTGQLDSSTFFDSLSFSPCPTYSLMGVNVHLCVCVCWGMHNCVCDSHSYRRQQISCSSTHISHKHTHAHAPMDL